MTERPDLNFCDSCDYRERTINGRRCKRADMDLLSRFAFIDPDTLIHIEDPEPGEVDISLAEAAISFSLDGVPEMIACAEIVSAGGEPLW